jgi:hypothetical protein
MSNMDGTPVDSSIAWEAFHTGRGDWSAWVEARLYERLIEERRFLEEVFGEALGTSTHDLRTEFTQAIAGLRAQRSLSVVGTYSGDRRYRQLDCVALNGASFCAKRDDPGPCPGDDWQLIASQGKAGKPGRDGTDGKAGKDAPRITGWLTNSASFTVVPIMSDGSRGAALDLRPLFERYNAETEGTS